MEQTPRGISALPGFDPCAVPALDLPPLPAAPIERLTPEAIRARFAHPPAWAPELRRDTHQGQPPGQIPRRAAVLVPLVMRPNELTVLLTERNSQLRSHAGQIAFPGGRADPQDKDLIETALREAKEEVDLSPQAAQVLGMLAPYVTSSRYDVTPVVALIEPDFAPKPNPDEVAAVFEVPLSFLMDPSHHRWHRFVQGGGPQGPGRTHEWFSMPYYGSSVAGGAQRQWFIWGATAGMLRNFYRFLMA